MATTYGKSAQSSAVQWFLHRITGTFLVFLLITHFWVQHFDRTTASVSHSVIESDATGDAALPKYSDEAVAAVRAARARQGQPARTGPRVITAAQQPERNDQQRVDGLAGDRKVNVHVEHLCLAAKRGEGQARDGR